MTLGNRVRIGGRWTLKPAHIMTIVLYCLSGFIDMCIRKIGRTNGQVGGILRSFPQSQLEQDQNSVNDACGT